MEGISKGARFFRGFSRDVFDGKEKSWHDVFIMISSQVFHVGEKAVKGKGGGNG